MQIGVQEARPPYVSFEVREVEDRAASIEAGHYVAKDVHFAVVTPAGSKDRHEKLAEDWFAQLEQQVREERFPREWYKAYKEAYAAWKEGREMPENGTSVTRWPVLSPSQVRQLLDLRVRTVEDLASANEETIMRLGMGGRSLKDKAVAWLAAANGPGKLAEEVSSLRQEIDAVKLRNTSLEEQNRELQAQVAALKGPKKL